MESHDPDEDTGPVSSPPESSSSKVGGVEDVGPVQSGPVTSTGQSGGMGG